MPYKGKYLGQKKERRAERNPHAKMKKNIFKKVAALAMSAAMVMMTALGASAATSDTIDTTKDVSLTIYKYDLSAAQQDGVDVSSYTADGERDTSAENALSKYALQGVVFTYLRVADITTSTSGGEIEVLYDLPNTLDSLLSLSTDAHTSDEINSALATALSSDNTATKNALEDYVSNNNGTTMNETNSSGITSASNLAQGLYLVVETSVPEEVYYTTDPFFVSLPMTDATGDYWVYDVYVYPKNQTNNPTVDKLVSENGNYGDTATASEGDILNYRLVSQLPSITSEATYLTQYTLVDTLSSGITYNKDAQILFYSSKSDADNGTGTPVATWSSAGAYFTASYGASSMTVNLTSAGLAAVNPAYSDLYMVVAYTATVNSNSTVVLGDTGNTNTVDLTYSRTNTLYSNTIEDVANVYTYGINLTKTFGADGGDATDVQFVLYNSVDDYWVTATGNNGVYYVTGQSTTEDGAEKFSPNADGSLIINGLEADTYVMTEVQTSDGFSLLRDSITISITQTDCSYIPSVASVTGVDNEYEEVTTTLVSEASATVDGSAASMSSDGLSENARVDMNILNSSTFTLPQTGGLGTILFTLAGALAVIIGAVVISKSRKKA